MKERSDRQMQSFAAAACLCIFFYYRREGSIYDSREKKRDDVIVFFSSSFSFLFLFLSPVNTEICKEWKEEKWRQKDSNTVKHIVSL